MFFLFFLLGCFQSKPLSEMSMAPEAIATSECDVCGMLVGEQPAPRGQLVYRDGTHAFTCSLQGLHSMVTTPDPRGQPVKVYVEDLGSGFDWTHSPTEPFPWVEAQDAFFVAGSRRDLVMGLPLLSYAQMNAAQHAADQLDSQPHSWSELIRFNSIKTFTKQMDK
jgi:nitrous oxide reductase accessory protein NosL